MAGMEVTVKNTKTTWVRTGGGKTVHLATCPQLHNPRTRPTPWLYAETFRSGEALLQDLLHHGAMGASWNRECNTCKPYDYERTD